MDPTGKTSLAGPWRTPRLPRTRRWERTNRMPRRSKHPPVPAPEPPTHDRVALEGLLAAQADPAGRIVAVATSLTPRRPQVVKDARHADREPVPRAQHGRQHDDRLGEVHRAGALRSELVGPQVIQARARQSFHDRARLVRRVIRRAHGESVRPACQRRYLAQYLPKIRRRHSALGPPAFRSCAGCGATRSRGSISPRHGRQAGRTFTPCKMRRAGPWSGFLPYSG